MADTFDFWTHGAAVVAQHTPHLTGDQNGLFMMPLSWGTVVRQDHGTSNWFHIPLPGASQLDDFPARLSHAWLRVKIGDDAEITKINVYNLLKVSDPHGPSQNELAVSDTDFKLRGREEEVTIDLKFMGRLISAGRGPMVMSIHVEFDGDGAAEERQVLFAGAGLSYEEKRDI